MSHLSSIPYFEKTKKFIIPEDNEYRLSIHADVLKVKRLNAPPPPHGKFARREVTGLSYKSRKRMIELLAMMVKPPDFFLTLTWSDDVASIDPEKFRPHFEAFRRRLEYHYPDLSAMWRLEVETRKSGEREGEPICHYHMLIWLPNMDTDFKMSLLKGGGKLWRSWWHDITGSQNEWHFKRYGLQLESIKSKRHAYHYVSKYVAKQTNDNMSIGRRWGRVGQFDTLPVFEIDLSRQNYIELKRLITTYFLKTRGGIGHMIRRLNPDRGMTAFGLGAWDDKNQGLFTSLIWKMLKHILEVTYQKRRML